MVASGELPVQFSRLPQWLMARKAIPQDYARLMSSVDLKVREALAEGATHEAAKKGAYDAFKSSHLGWVCEARALMQDVTYGIPALKKQVAACEKQMADAAARQVDLERAEAAAKAKYDALLKEVGVEGLDPEWELLVVVASEVPKFHAEVEEVIRSSVSEIAEYYGSYARHASGEPADGSCAEVLLLRALARQAPEADLEALAPELRSLRAAREAPEDARPAIGSSPLNDASVRELLRQEVTELDGFLRERCAELSPGAAQVSAGPPGMEDETLQRVQAFADVVRRLDELLTSKKTQRLLLWASSDRYLNQTVQRVELAKQQCSKPAAQRAKLDEAKAEQADEAKRARAELEDLRAATQKRQQELEAELTAHFKAPVKIVGEINEL